MSNREEENGWAKTSRTPRRCRCPPKKMGRQVLGLESRGSKVADGSLRLRLPKEKDVEAVVVDK